MPLTKVTSGVRTLGTGEVATANMAVDPTNASNLSSGSVPAAQLGNAGTTWQAVTTGTTLTAVAGNGYPINTTSNVCTVTLPASASVGDTIEFMDYARKWGTNAVTLNVNSLNYQGNSSPNPVYDTDGEALRIVYADATQGWVPMFDGAVALETPQTSDIEWLVIAGGGGGGTGRAVAGDRAGGGGGAGGYRNSFASEASGGGASTESSISAIAQGVVLTATVGAGGAGAGGNTEQGSDGAVSSLAGTGITTISTVGGGGGGANNVNGTAGGSGGGGGADNTNGGAGTSNQGYAGGDAFSSSNAGGGGGGAAAVGQSITTGNQGCNGGAGLDNTITGASVGRGGGGGAAGGTSTAGAGTHGGGDGQASGASTAGTANTGGGGGSSLYTSSKAGGSGVVILRLLTASYSGTTTGSPTVATDGSHTVITFTGTGTYTT
jgi:hypothetical protein